VGVDNILERIEGIDEDLILRVGPAQSIAPSVVRYSIGKRREQHPLWNEVIEHENTIKKCYEDIENRGDELRGIQNNIKQIQIERDEIESKLKEFQEKKEKFDLLTKESKPLPIKKLVDLKVKEKEISNKEITASQYYSLAIDILEFKVLEKDLPKGEDYYQLEEDIQEMYNNKSKERISGFLRRKDYQKYLDDLKKMETSYNEMTESYNQYWKIRDPVEVKYKKLYSDREGKPDEDAVKCELNILNVHQEYLELKKDELTNKIEYNKDKLIYDSYVHYLESIDYSKQTQEGKIKSLNTQIHLLVTEKDRLISEIRNIKNTISKHQEEQLEIILSIEREILDNAQIIATTVISSAQYLLDEEKFDLMLMDEASQVATYMSLMTLLKCKKFILVGDHKQLQPIPEEKLKSDLNLSIFNRLISLYPENYTFLDTQYRMNQEIAELSSELFYEGKLKTHPSISAQTLNLDIESNLKELINPFTPITFIDTTGLDYYEEGTGSGCENKYEAKLTVQIVQTLLNHLDPQQIGVITPYVKQRESISKKLDNPQVEVDTVHRFQGREKDVIILSFCKSKVGRSYTEFIGKPSQINVAISRARKKLIIIGNSRTIRQSELIDELLKRVGKENTILYEDFLKINLN